MKHKLLKYLKESIDEIIIQKDEIKEEDVSKYSCGSIEWIDGKPFRVWYSFWFFTDFPDTKWHHTTDDFSKGIRYILERILGYGRCECVYRDHDMHVEKRRKKRESPHVKTNGYVITTKICHLKDNASYEGIQRD